MDQLQENEKLVAEFTETWEEKVRRADSIRQQRSVRRVFMARGGGCGGGGGGGCGCSVVVL